jgi:hypothetical protein
MNGTWDGVSLVSMLRCAFRDDCNDNDDDNDDDGVVSAAMSTTMIAASITKRANIGRRRTRCRFRFVSSMIVATREVRCRCLVLLSELGICERLLTCYYNIFFTKGTKFGGLLLLFFYYYFIITGRKLVFTSRARN